MRDRGTRHVPGRSAGAAPLRGHVQARKDTERACWLVVSLPKPPTHRPLGNGKFFWSEKNTGGHKTKRTKLKTHHTLVTRESPPPKNSLMAMSALACERGEPLVQVP